MRVDLGPEVLEVDGDIDADGGVGDAEECVWGVRLGGEV